MMSLQRAASPLTRFQPSGKLQDWPCCSQQQNLASGAPAVSGTASIKRSLRGLRGAKEKNGRQGGAIPPLFVTFETVSQAASEALLVAASDLAVVDEADGRYVDVFATPLTPQQLQLQQMLEERMRELVRDALHVDMLLKTFAAAYESRPGRHIVATVPPAQLSARSSIDSCGRAAPTAQASGTAGAPAEAQENLAGESSKSSSQIATRCASAVAGPPTAANQGTAASPALEAATVSTDGGRVLPKEPLPIRSVTEAPETRLESCQPCEGKNTNSSGPRIQQGEFPHYITSTAGVCNTTVDGTSAIQHTAVSGLVAAPGVESVEPASSAAFHSLDGSGHEASWTSQRGQRSTGEAIVPAEVNRDAQGVQKEDKKVEDDNAHQEALQLDCLCDLFMHIVRFCYREQYTAAETSTLLGIVKEVLQRAVVESETPLGSFRYFRRLLLKHSVQRPPLSIRVFTPRTLQSSNRFVVNTFYRHFQLYVQCFTPEVHAVTVQQPVPVTTMRRLNLASCRTAAAGSPHFVAAASGRERNMWSMISSGGGAGGVYGGINSNESSPADALFPMVPGESNEPLAKSKGLFAEKYGTQEP